ncbi:MAG: DUF120 domain-containing protein [Candidatus Bathyarchaeia archaeon]
MIKPRLWFFLYNIARLGAIDSVVKVSTLELARETETSQQTASRLLIELVDLGLIRRSIVPDGSALRLTSKGVEELKSVHSALEMLLEPRERFITLEGEVFDGLGEGRWYMSQSGYREQFMEKLGFDPFLGTLNLRLDPLNQGLRKELESYPSIRIDGFPGPERSFGAVNCYRATINEKVEGAVIITERGHYDSSVLELIAPMSLKKRLGLKAGSKVRVRVQLS